MNKRIIVEKNKKSEAGYEKKRVRNGLIFTLCFGIVMVVFSTLMFFGYCRPFTKFEYCECIVENQEWFEVDKYHVRVIYYVDGENMKKYCL